MSSTGCLGMGTITIKVEGYRCERCGHEWVPRQARNLPPTKDGKKAPKPRLCPNCKSAWWDTPPREK